jgi:hypothetical protein
MKAGCLKCGELLMQRVRSLIQSALNNKTAERRTVRLYGRPYRY